MNSLARQPPACVVDVQSVRHEATWRGTTYTLTFLRVDRELDGDQLLDVCRWADSLGLENPRVLTPRFIAWSALFQPTLHVVHRWGLESQAGPPTRWIDTGETPFEPDLIWLQSVIFLAGVTLSAAIVQGRWSRGTLESKFDRLWQAASARAYPSSLDPTSLRQRIRDLARLDREPIDTLLALRREFLVLAGELSARVPSSTVEVTRAPEVHTERFGFVDDLAAELPGTSCMIAYGSSVSSENFADIDLVLITKDPEGALRKLENRRPTWRGKELNIGVYDSLQFRQMQLLSGDNLAEYGACIYGGTALPEKQKDALLTRNLSFGIVRQRQQLGMAASAQKLSGTSDDDRQNLHHYFVKIPLNVAKGTFGAAGVRRSKEDLNAWLWEHTGFDTAREQALVFEQGPALPLARAAVATGDALARLNAELGILKSELREAK